MGPFERYLERLVRQSAPSRWKNESDTVVIPTNGPFVRKSLAEKLFDEIDGTKVFVNPSRDELEAILRVSRTKAARGLRDARDVFIWTEDDGTHGFVAEQLFLHIDTAFYIRRSFNKKNEYVVALSDFSGPTGDRARNELIKTPNFSRIFTGAKIVEPEYA